MDVKLFEMKATLAHVAVKDEIKFSLLDQKFHYSEKYGFW